MIKESGIMNAAKKLMIFMLISLLMALPFIICGFLFYLLLSPTNFLERMLWLMFTIIVGFVILVIVSTVVEEVM